MSKDLNPKSTATPGGAAGDAAAAAPSAQGTFDAARQNALQAGGDFMDGVRGAPLKSILIAGAVGLVLGVLVRRR